MYQLGHRGVRRRELNDRPVSRTGAPLVPSAGNRAPKGRTVAVVKSRGAAAKSRLPASETMDQANAALASDRFVRGVGVDLGRIERPVPTHHDERCVSYQRRFGLTRPRFHPMARMTVKFRAPPCPATSSRPRAASYSLARTSERSDISAAVKALSSPTPFGRPRRK